MLIISILIVALFLFFAIAVKHLKWYGLIAGYNTAKKEYKEKIDIARIGKMMGNVFYIIALLWAVNFLLLYRNIDNTGLVGIIGTLIGISYVVIKAQMYDHNPGKKLRVAIAIIVMWVIISGVAGLLVYGAKESCVTFTTDKLSISGMYGIDVPYADISDVSLKDDLPKISKKLNGFNFGDILKGTFAVENVDNARLFLHSKRPPFLFINTKKVTIILNSKNSDKTKMWYIRIDNKIKPTTNIIKKI